MEAGTHCGLFLQLGVHGGDGSSARDNLGGVIGNGWRWLTKISGVGGGGIEGKGEGRWKG